jgi:hypothetical protein
MPKRFYLLKLPIASVVRRSFIYFPIELTLEFYHWACASVSPPHTSIQVRLKQNWRELGRSE